ncbi:MAG: cyanoexosortase A system-associated protein [Cyanobacteria bacterium J06560_2]
MNLSRSVPLAVVSLAIAAVTIKTTLQPLPKTPSYANYTFPETVPLAQWQSVKPTVPMPETLETQTRKDITADEFVGDIVATHHYRYQQNRAQLSIYAQYLVNTNGNIKSVITEQTGQPLTSLSQDPNRGYYSLSAHRGNATLHTCQNARGTATVTTDQFNRNRMIYDLQPSRILPWLTGQDTLPDQRCLWTQLSVSLSNYESEAAAYAALEAAWIDWADWWGPHFPAT